MQPSTPLCCWQCGTVISATGGRCPACGVEQQNDAPLKPGPSAPLAGLRLPGRAAFPTPGARSLPVVPLAVAGGALAGLVAVGVLLAGRTRHEETPAPTPSAARPAQAPESPADPGNLAGPDKTRVDPAELVGKARTRALAWSKEAVLVSLKAAPVVGGRVDLTSHGTVELTFARPTGEGFGADTKVAGKAFRIVVTGDGTVVGEDGVATGRAALEPNCPFEEALRKAQAAGLPATGPVTVGYEVSGKHQRAVWRFGVEGEADKARLVDGNSCLILVR